MKNKYQNSIETEKRFKQALGELISETHDVNCITVSQIVKKVGVNRGTFYNHYTSISDLIDSIQIDILNYLQELNMSNEVSILDPSTYIYKVLAFIQTEDQFYRYILPYSSRQAISLLKKEIIAMLYHNQELKKHCHCSNEEFLYRISFTINGIIDVFIDYFCNQLPITQEQFITYTIETIQRELVRT